MQMGELWQFSPRAIVNYCILTTAQSKGRPAPCATVWITSPKILCVGGLGPRRVLLGKVVGHLKGGALWEVLRSLWDMPLKDMLGFRPLPLPLGCLAGEVDGFALSCAASRTCHLTTG